MGNGKERKMKMEMENEIMEKKIKENGNKRK
jgi:hypothetical protein